MITEIKSYQIIIGPVGKHEASAIACFLPALGMCLSCIPSRKTPSSSAIRLLMSEAAGCFALGLVSATS